jgi:hypothetical protein
MMSVFLADISKLRRPLTLWLTLATVAVSILFAAQSHSQVSGLRQGTRMMVADTEQALARLSDPLEQQMLGGDPEENRAMFEDSLRFSREELTRTMEETGLSVATQGPLGALGIALGMLCSLVGALVILIAASGHVAGEWTGLTIKETLIADRRRGLTVGDKGLLDGRRQDSIFVLAEYLAADLVLDRGDPVGPSVEADIRTGFGGQHLGGVRLGRSHAVEGAPHHTVLCRFGRGAVGRYQEFRRDALRWDRGPGRVHHHDGVQ